VNKPVVYFRIDLIEYDRAPAALWDFKADCTLKAEAGCEIYLVKQTKSKKHVYEYYEAKFNDDFQDWFLRELKLLQMKCPALKATRVTAKGGAIG
jgi:hypothetical protein